MLYQDFRNQVVPYRHNPDAYEMSTTGIPHYDVDEALSLGMGATGLDGFVREVASRLLTNHEVWLEVGFDDKKRDGAPFAVLEVDGVRETNTGNSTREPRNRGESNGLFSEKCGGETRTVVDATRIVHELLPVEYSSQLLMQVIRDLAEIDPSPVPPWVMDRWTVQPHNSPPFDVTEFNRTKRLRIAQVALPIGWTAREIFHGVNSHVTEYYHYFRELRFLHFRSSMRARAEDALRQVLALAGERSGFVASVTAHGVHTPDEVREFTREFEAGSLPFSVVSDILFEKANGPQLKSRQVV